MTMPTEAHILYDNTSAANTAQDTGAIDVKDYDSIAIIQVSGVVVGTPAVSYEFYDASGTALAIATGNLTTGSTRQLGGWGPGCSVSINGMLGLATALPASIRIQVAALGSTITGRLVLIGRKRYRQFGI